MTQRIFDVKNEQDVKDLFGILEENIDLIKLGATNEAVIYYKDTKYNFLSKSIFNINWHDLTEIKRPVDYSEYIGKLGWFMVNNDKDKLGILETCGTDESGILLTMEGFGWFYRAFRPLTLEEIKEKGLV